MIAVFTGGIVIVGAQVSLMGSDCPGWGSLQKQPGGRMDVFATSAGALPLPPTTGPQQGLPQRFGFCSPAVFCVRTIDDGFLDLRSEEAKRKISQLPEKVSQTLRTSLFGGCAYISFCALIAPLMAMCLCRREDGLLPPSFFCPLLK